MKRKRRLTDIEIEKVRDWMNNASQGQKPSIRMIANRLGVSRSSVIKSLGGWKGIQRGMPETERKPSIIDSNISSPINIEPMTTRIPEGIKYG